MADMGKPHGFPKEEKIRARSEFDRVFQEGRRLAEGPVLARYVPNGLQFTRMAVAVPNKFGKAAKRNRARRLLKEAYRLHKQEMPPGLDLILLPGRGWHSPSLAELEAVICRIAARLK